MIVMLLGHATAEATRRFAARFGNSNGFYRQAGDISVSSLGIGTYLGGLDTEMTRRYTASIIAAVQRGVNVIDTSLNYRHQRSEQAVGVALIKLKDSRVADRDDLVICTKAGYLVPDAVPDGLDPREIAGGMHCLAPRFLADQVERSRRNIGVETIDVLYLHNPETQLDYVEPAVWESRMQRAFELLEEMVRRGTVRAYGVATWNAFRSAAPVSLARLLALASEVGGVDHHLRFVQLPFNLAMTEAVTQQAQERESGSRASLLDIARESGTVVVASASLLQARLATGLPPQAAPLFGALKTDAQRALQFARSAPGIAVALAGMSNPAHVEENCAIRETPPLTAEQFARLTAGANA